MFVVYIACLIFGGILMLFSLFSGVDSESASYSIDSHDFDHHIGDSHSTPFNRVVSQLPNSVVALNEMIERGCLININFDLILI